MLPVHPAAAAKKSRPTKPLRVWAFVVTWGRIERVFLAREPRPASRQPLAMRLVRGPILPMDDATKIMENITVIERRLHGFVGQHHAIVPPDVVRTARRHPLLSGLLPTASGYFP